MSRLEVVQEGDTPEGTLKEMLAKADQLESVIILAINKDGTQFGTTSRMSMYQKCFLHSFWGAWINRWFSEAYDPR